MYFVCVERSLYWLIWISATVYALYQFACICQSQNHLYRLVNQLDFRDGSLSKNQYDATDFEWQSFKKLYINYWYIVLVHVVLSNVFTVYNHPNFKLISWILITLYAICAVFSISALVIILINVVILVLVALGGRSLLCYALCSGVVLASQSTEIANRLFNFKDSRMTNEFDFEEKRFLFTWCICFLNARGLSAAVDNEHLAEQINMLAYKDRFHDKLLTITAYLLYLPGFFAGPLYLFDDFEAAIRVVEIEPEKKVFLGSNYFKAMTALFLLMANVIYYEWLLHWLYSSALTADYELIGNYNAWQLSGFVVSLCLLFYMKYTCIYGTFKVLTTFDGVASVAPSLPQCVAAMHLSSQLWRKFDVGIYAWLRKYIYDPIVKPANSTFRRFLATFVCFVCVAFWHLPLTPTLIMWLTLNIISAFIEIWARALRKTEFWIKMRVQLSRPNYMRLLALISLPLFLLAIFSNLFFLSVNEQVGYEFAKRVLNNTNNYAIWLMFVLYCGANVSLDYNKVVKSSVDFAQHHGFGSCSAPKTSAKQTKKSN